MNSFATVWWRTLVFRQKGMLGFYALKASLRWCNFSEWENVLRDQIIFYALYILSIITLTITEYVITYIQGQFSKKTLYIFYSVYTWAVFQLNVIHPLCTFLFFNKWRTTLLDLLNLPPGGNQHILNRVQTYMLLIIPFNLIYIYQS